jgi:hypothetical protein
MPHAKDSPEPLFPAVEGVVFLLVPGCLRQELLGNLHGLVLGRQGEALGAGTLRAVLVHGHGGFFAGWLSPGVEKRETGRK